MFAHSKELGVGVVYSPALERILDLSQLDVLEIEPRMFWLPPEGGRPAAVDREALARLRDLPQQKLIHTAALPVGGSLRFDAASLALLQHSVGLLEPRYASQHLGFDRIEIGGEERFTGMLLPARYTEAGARAAAASLIELRASLGLEIAFETGVSYLRRDAREMPDGTFFARVADEADCGILLDLHDLATNERNGGDRAYEVIVSLPRERVWQLHLAGGYAYGGFWVDAHSGAIDPYALELAETTIGEFPNLRAIVFEIAPEFVENLSPAAAADQIEQLRKLWRRRARRRTVAPCVPPVADSDASGAELREWQSALGSLALGRCPEGAFAGLASDPGAALLSDLVDSAREATLFERVPLTMRLLSVYLGAAAFRSLLFSYLRSRAPDAFAAVEVEHFLEYVETEAAIVTYLPHVVSFERASLAAAGGAVREIRLDCDPTALLAALAARHVPRELPGGEYVVRFAGSHIEIVDARTAGFDEAVTRSA